MYFIRHDKQRACRERYTVGVKRFDRYNNSIGSKTIKTLNRRQSRRT